MTGKIGTLTSSHPSQLRYRPYDVVRLEDDKTFHTKMPKWKMNVNSPRTFVLEVIILLPPLSNNQQSCRNLFHLICTMNRSALTADGNQTAMMAIPILLLYLVPNGLSETFNRMDKNTWSNYLCTTNWKIIETLFSCPFYNTRERVDRSCNRFRYQLVEQCVFLLFFSNAFISTGISGDCEDLE